MSAGLRAATIAVREFPPATFKEQIHKWNQIKSMQTHRSRRKDVGVGTQVLPQQPSQHRVPVGDEALNLLLLFILTFGSNQGENHQDEER